MGGGGRRIADSVPWGVEHSEDLLELPPGGWGEIIDQLDPQPEIRMKGLDPPVNQGPDLLIVGRSGHHSNHDLIYLCLHDLEDANRPDHAP